MKTFIAIFSYFLLSSSFIFASASTASGDFRIYQSHTAFSVIGTNAINTFDDPFDNSHTFEIIDLPEHFDAYVTFEVKGVNASSSLTKSVNGGPSQGGYLQTKSNEWTKVSERISSDLVIQGKNKIVYSLHASDHLVELRNVEMKIQPKKGSIQYLEIENNSLSRTHDLFYIRGYAHTEIEELYINGESVFVDNGVFEYLGTINSDVICVSAFDGRGDSSDHDLPLADFHFSEEWTGLLPADEKSFFSSGEEELIEYKGVSACWTNFSIAESCRIGVKGLRKVDVPQIQPDILNATAQSYAYRISNNCAASAKIDLTLNYDLSKLPQGYYENDVKLFGFDSALERWVELGLAKNDQTVVSTSIETGKYNDFIAGVIKVPESPETAGFVPTSIKDFKASDASEGIVQMSPPSANNMGSATTSFLIKIPAGRQGMQPSLAVSYNNQGGNGILGLGWNLPISQISVDTRWGVPRYNQDFNSETYLFDGAMLDNVAHREEGFMNISRQSGQVYHPRVEGGFRQITRLGNSPSNHYWRVVDKSGTTFFYGGVDSVENNAVLRDDSGNIAKWTLVRVENANGHFMEYNCSVETVSGESVAANGGRQIFLNKIQYTGHDDDQGKYSVEFNYETGRADVSVNCRKGFKEVQNRLLSEIEVYYGTEIIRSYDFEYSEGAFSKSLLQSISEVDLSDNQFYQYDFDYYNEFDAGNFFDNSFSSWDTSAERVEGKCNALPLFGGLVAEDELNDYASGIGGNDSKNTTIGGSFVIGLGGNVFKKGPSVGANFSLTRSTSEGKAALLDINGDGKPDKIYREEGQVFFRENISQNSNEFVLSDTPVVLPSFPGNNFSKSKTKSKSHGVEANAGAGPFSAFYGLNSNSSETVTEIYLVDRNGDDLVDVVKDGLVYFNHLDDQGIPDFELLSSVTENPILAGATMSDDIFNVDPIEYTSTFEEEQPLHDAVKVWVAPFKGDIDISCDNITLVNTSLIPENIEYDGNLDGVYLAIQKSDDVLWKDSLNIQNPEIDFGTISTSVHKGQRLYFRVNSKYDGLQDKVTWNPHITYTDFDNVPDDMPEADTNGKPYAEYDSEADFLLFNDQSLFLGREGQLVIEGEFHKIQNVTDNIIVRVMVLDTDGMQIGEPWYEHNVSWNSGVVDLDISGTLTVTPEMLNHEVVFEVYSTTNIDWSQIEWKPRVYFSDFNPQDGPQYFYPVVSNNMYSRIHCQLPNGISTVPHAKTSEPFIIGNNLEIPESEMVQVSAAIKMNRLQTIVLNCPDFETEYEEINDPEFNSLITVSLKGEGGEFYGSKSYNYNSNVGMDFLDEKLVVIIPNGSSVYAEIFIGSAYFAEALGERINCGTFNLQYNINCEIEEEYPVGTTNSTYANDYFLGDKLGIWTKPKLENCMFGNQYRGWGQIIYRGNEFSDDNFPAKIDEEDFEFLDPDDLAGSVGNVNSNEDLEGETGLESFDPVSAPIALMCLDAEREVWFSYDEDVFVGASEWSSSRLGEDDPNFPTFSGEENAIEAPQKRSCSSGDSNSGGGSSPILGANFSGASSIMTSKVDLLDFNGDKYPDYLNDSLVQYTTPLGGLVSDAIEHNQGIHEGSSDVNGFAVSGSAVVTSQKNSGALSTTVGGVTFFVGNNGGAQASSASENAGSAIGVSLSANVSSNITNDRVVSTWLDINGDGLPDKIDDTLGVSLNLGYSFSEPQLWSFTDIRKGKSKDYSAGIGVSLFNGSIQGGLGASWSENFTLKGFADINSDGLQDIIFSDPDNNDEIKSYRLNLGDSFSQEINLNSPSLKRLDQSYSSGQSANAAFTVGVSFLFFKICVNPRVAKGRGFSRQESQFMDVDGDGFQDYIYSTENNDNRVLFSKIGKTNMLKSVNGPFNGSFTVDYEVTPTTYEYPNPKWVMNSLEIYDGHEGDGEDNMFYVFDYAHGNYDRREREDYGFANVTTISLDTLGDVYRSYETVYDNVGYYTNGLVLRETLKDAEGNKWTEVTNEYELKDGNGDNLNADFNTTNDFGWAYPALVSTSDIFYEGEVAGSIERKIDFEYDNIGNVTRFKDYGNNAGEDDLDAIIEYHSQGNILNIPSAVIVENNGFEYRKREQDIDGNGNVTEIRQFFEDGFIKHNLEYYPSGGSLAGMLKKHSKPENINGERMSYEYEYDDHVFQYITRIEDAYGYTSENVYEYKFGQLLQNTDLNDNVISYEIDERGRVEAVVGPYEQETDNKTIKIEYFENASTPYAVIKHFDPEIEGNEILTVTFLDGLFRPIQIKQIGAIWSNISQSEETSFIASGNIVYDEFGRKVSQSHPANTQNYNTSQFYDGGSDFATQTAYDVLDRALLTTLPDLSTSNNTYSIDDNTAGVQSFKTRSEDMEGNLSESFTDAKGRGLKTIRYIDGTPVPVSYSFNAMNELLEVEDVAGNISRYTYDLLGRKLTFDHPDAGLNEYEYDNANNMLRQITPNLRETFPGQGIEYSYEYQRLLKIEFPENHQNYIRYTYGEPGADFNRAGRIVVQEDASGGQEFYYGKLGENTKTVRTILVNAQDWRTYISETTYDTWNRIQTMTYPDGETVEYGYNVAGKLKDMRSTKEGFTYDILKNVGYDEFEQRVFIKYGNNSETTYTYEPDRRRLANLNTQTANNRVLMDNDYAYDNMNNILELTNNASIPTSGELGGRSNQNYEYDDLYRLVGAQGSFQGADRDEEYTLDMEYDLQYNILAKMQNHISNGETVLKTSYDHFYTYETNKPHAPTLVGEFANEYDDNGNLTQSFNGLQEPTLSEFAQYEWDERNNLESVWQNGVISRYTYDAANQRVIKSYGNQQAAFTNGAISGFVAHQENFTLYVSPYMVVSPSGFTKHYFIESQRVLSKLGEGEFQTGGALGAQIYTAGSIDFEGRLDVLNEAEQIYTQTYSTPDEPTVEGFNPNPVEIGVSVVPNTESTYSVPAQNWPNFYNVDPNDPNPPVDPPLVPADSLTAGYLYSNDNPVAENAHFFYHADHLGNTGYITGVTGNVVQHSEYLPFGETLVFDESTDAEYEAYLFNGKELDEETGLYYYGARYYNPKSSVWLSTDPLTERHLDKSPIAYTIQNPILYVDKEGLFEEYPDGQNQSQEWIDTPEMRRISEEIKFENTTDPSTLNGNLFNWNFTGRNNPLKYNGETDFSVSPSNLSDAISYQHDLDYEKLNVHGLSGLLTSTEAIDADWKFVKNQFKVAFDLNNNLSKGSRMKSAAAGLGLGSLATPKTIYKSIDSVTNNTSDNIQNAFSQLNDPYTWSRLRMR